MLNILPDFYFVNPFDKVCEKNRNLLHDHVTDSPIKPYYLRKFWL